MQERIDRIENIVVMSVRLAEIMQESQRRIEENQREMAALLQQLTQAVAVMQADIVRTDETHA